MESVVFFCTAWYASWWDECEFIDLKNMFILQYFVNKLIVMIANVGIINWFFKLIGTRCMLYENYMIFGLYSVYLLYKIYRILLEWYLGYQAIYRRICQCKSKASVAEQLRNRPQICNNLLWKNVGSIHIRGRSLNITLSFVDMTGIRTVLTFVIRIVFPLNHVNIDISQYFLHHTKMTSTRHLYLHFYCLIFQFTTSNTARYLLEFWIE